MKIESSVNSGSTGSASVGSGAANVGTSSSSGSGLSGDKAVKNPDKPVASVSAPAPAPAPTVTIPPVHTSTTESGLFQAPPRVSNTDNARVNIRLECLDSKTTQASQGSASAENKPEGKPVGKSMEKSEGMREGVREEKSALKPEGKPISPSVASALNGNHASTNSTGSTAGGAGNINVNITRTTATYGSVGVAVDASVRVTVVVNDEKASLPSPVTYATSYPPKGKALSTKPLMSDKDRRLSDSKSQNNNDNGDDVSVTYATSYPKPVRPSVNVNRANRQRQSNYLKSGSNTGKSDSVDRDDEIVDDDGMEEEEDTDWVINPLFEKKRSSSSGSRGSFGSGQSNNLNISPTSFPASKISPKVLSPKVQRSTTPNCTIQPDFNRSKKAWEDLKETLIEKNSPRANSVSVPGHSNHSNEDMKTKPTNFTNDGGHSSGTSLPSSSRGHQTPDVGTNDTNVRVNNCLETDYDDDVDVEEIEEDDVVVLDMREGDENDHSIEEDEEGTP